MAEITHENEKIQIAFEAQETALLAGLLDEMRIFLEADIPRQDAVATRLFPNAYEDERDSQAYRELVDDALRAEKMRALEEVQRLLKSSHENTVVMSPEQAESFLAVANDVRLAIGTRLEVDEEKMSQEPDADSPEAPAYAVLHWLGYLQEMVVDGLKP